LAGIRDSLGFPEPNLYWYENPGWERHDIANLPRIDVGHTMGDVDGDGREDLLVAQGIKNHDVYWLRQPEDHRQRWDVFLITDSYEKYHDLAFGDIDDDGKPEVVGLSQESGVIFYYDIPSDPTAEPWPENHRHIVAEGLSVEGAALADIDGDGQTELIAGPNVFHREAKDWRRQVIAEDGWDDARVAVADVDDDGVPEVILTEGDSPHLVDNPGRVAIFDPPDWSRTLLSEEMFCPHSVQVADFNGDGNPDIYVAEMGLGENEDPQHVVFENQGDGRFEPVTVADGVATHEAKVANVTGTGRPDIVGKSYGPDHHVDVLYNE
jgi:hypothetical protein